MKTLFTLLFLFLGISLFSQETPPTGTTFKPLSSPSFKYNTLDSTVWMYKGYNYGWTHFAKVAPPIPMLYPASGIPNSTGSVWGASYNTTGSGSQVALATSPVFITPTLGVADATSLNVPNSIGETGVIYKDGVSFIHNFKHPTGATVAPSGNNLFVGLNAGNFTMGSTAVSMYQGSANVGVGDYSLQNLTEGSYNVGVGTSALRFTTTGIKNTAVGEHALSGNTQGDDNTGIGYMALGSNLTGYGNTAVGNSALSQNTNSENTAVGYSSSGSVTTGLGNASFGAHSLRNNPMGDFNVALGYSSINNISSGSNNIAVGAYAGSYLSGSGNQTSGNNSIFVGYETKSLYDNQTNQIVIGYSSVGNGSNTATWGNTSITKHYFSGSIVIPSTTSSNNGVIYKGIAPFIHDFQHINVSGPNLFVGKWSGNFTMGSTAVYGYQSSENTGVGDYTLSNLTTGKKNVAVGTNVLNQNTSGDYNTGIGNYSLYRTTTGQYNTGVGKSTLEFNITGNENTAIGYYALLYNTGNSNTSVGFSSGSGNTTGNGNSSFGSQSLGLNETGGVNVSIGQMSMYTNKSGSRNVAVGASAGAYGPNSASNATGTNSVFIGYYTKPLLDNQTNQIVIGSDVTGNGSNTATWGNTEISKHYFSGNLVSTGLGNIAPTSATDTGIKGEIRFTDLYIFVCTATNTWKRTAISTW